eukprot:813499_1
MMLLRNSDLLLAILAIIQQIRCENSFCLPLTPELLNSTLSATDPPGHIGLYDMGSIKQCSELDQAYDCDLDCLFGGGTATLTCLEGKTYELKPRAQCHPKHATFGLIIPTPTGKPPSTNQISERVQNFLANEILCESSVVIPQEESQT